MTRVQKILVVGAGVAGPAMCYWLRQFGFSPVLIEKSPSLRTGGQPIDVRGAAIDLTRKMGIYDKICAVRTQIKSWMFVDAAGTVLHEEHGRIGFNQGEDVEARRGDIIEIVMKTIEDVPCYFNRNIESIVQGADGVTVAFNDARVEHYDLVIGADGIHSSIRRMVFGKGEYELLNLGMYLSTFSFPNYLNLNHANIECESGRKLISIFSDRDSEIASAGFMFRSDNLLKNIRDKNEQMQVLRDLFKDFGWEAQRLLELMPASTDFYFDLATQVKMPSWTKGRIALIGDAGYCASPLSGQGNNLAFIGGYILAGELKKSGGDYKTAFKRYNDLLHSFVAANQQLGKWVSEIYLVDEDISQERVEERMSTVMEELQKVANGINLPNY